MKKIWLLFIMLTGCTQQSKKSFGTIDPNPIVESRKTNKINYYETFSVNADTLVKNGTYKLDNNGKAIEINAHYNHETFYIEYDSLGQQSKHMRGDQILFTETFTYESLPQQQLLIIKAYDKGRDKTGVSYLKYNKNLTHLLRKTMIDLKSKDTIQNFTYEYKNDKLTKVKAPDHFIEYYYDQAYKLKEVKTISGYGILIDYISPATGLIDSTVSDEEGQKLVTYYKYYK